MTTTKSNTTIRLSPEEREEIEEKMESFGFSQLSPFIRYAVKQLKSRRSA